jgi:hypothetical protein
MLQLNLPAALLRALKGPAISIVVACLIEPQRHLAIPDLQALTGYSPNTIRDGLNTLSELGLIQRAKNRYQLTDRMQQIMLPPPSEQQDTDRDQARILRGQNPRRQNPRGQNLDPPTVSAQKLRGAPQNLSQSQYCGCTDPDSQPGKPTPDTLAQPAQKSSATYRSLVDAGVYSHVARALAADPWITAERVEAWLQDLRDQNRRRPGTVRSVPAVLAANLKAHHDPPCQPEEPENDRRRYTSGRYAEYILS